MPLSDLHPIIRQWFSGRLGAPTDPQRLGWPLIRSGRDTLIAAPTGSGKTMAAFLSAIDSLFREGQPFGLPDEIRVVYVSPLKALSNDIHRNLQGPLAEIEALALREGVFTAPIRVEVRTGDTPAAARQAMLRRPPHILVTTPESLYLLLTAEKSRKILRTVTTVILDEIHAVARDKRGSHLALSLERLDAVCAARPQRIGLSATQKPMETVAKFLVGTARAGNGGNPDCALVDVGHDRKLDLAIEDPPGELSAVCSNEQWDGIYQRLSDLVRSHRSTLIFVNTRRFAERITHHLTELLGPEAVSSHHGSLSKKLRLDAEQLLKAGRLKAVVATASLELGIDIGFVDLVIQIGSPRSIATFLQRVGRSGHALGLVPKGRLFALTRDELMECAALIRSVRKGLLDRIEIPDAPLDILAQQIVAEVAADERDTDAVFDLFRGAWPYRNLERTTFDRVVDMLAEGFSSGSGRAGAYLHHDRIGGKLRARRGARLSALTSGGAIPELADYRVVAYPDLIAVGSVDEDFAIESMSGDIFLLGNTSWKILHVRGGEVAVSDAHGAPPTIPFWRGEAPGRTVELSRALSDLRQELSNRIDHPNDAAAWLKNEVPVTDSAAGQIVHYLAAQKAAAGMLPTQDHLLFERFFDESGGMQLVIHSPYGSRINRAWGLALRKSFCRTFDFELQASADDDGIVISLGPQQSFPLETIPKMVTADAAGTVLEQALLAAPMFMTRWRWNANRALVVLRSRGGKRVPPPLQRMRADDLLVKAFPQQMACRENLPQGDIPIPDHPLVFQTVADCLHEAMDKDRWLDLLRSIEEGRIRITAIDSREPTPFSYEILNANPYAFLDDAPLEERRARAVATRRTLTIESVRDIGKLDPHAIDQVRREAWPVVRDADELHDALSVMGMLPEAEGCEWGNFFDVLVLAGRATRAAASNGPRFWIATEQWPMVRAARPDLSADPEPRIPEGVRSDWSAAEAWVALVRGRIEVAGPVTVDKLSADLGLESHHVESALGALEAQGIVLRGRFTSPADPGAMHGAPTESDGPPLSEDQAPPVRARGVGVYARISGTSEDPSLHPHGPPNIIEWCARNLLTRIHRLTLDRLRRQIEPSTVAQFFQFLFRWHHLEPGTQLHGPEALAAEIERLQGFEIPAVAWEHAVLPLRLRKYDTAWLDELCMNGEVAWGRISPPSVDSEDPKSRFRAATKVLPVSLWIREDDPWLKWRDSEPRESVLSSNARTVFEILKMRGATFFPDLIREAHLLPTQVEEALWELVATGLVTGDGFAGIRSLANPLRKQQEAKIRRLRSRGRAVHAVRRGAGRWTLMPRPVEAMKDEAILEAWAHQLLHRYGILFRDLLAREASAPPWHLLRPVLRRMEARGQVHGGRFVTGVSGEQYAMPEAVESLRHIRREPPSDHVVFISAVDPVNLAGILTPGPRVTSSASNLLAFYAGNLAGFSKGGTVWVEEILPAEVKQTIRRTLETGKVL